MMQYALGVDGGGSKTLALVVDAQGHEVGRGEAGSSNHNSVGLQKAVEHIFAAVDEATHNAGCQVPLKGAWLGLAGVDGPTDHQKLFPHLSSLAETVHLTNDAELLLSALDGAIGVALIVGTGSIALGRDAQGTTARAGGWGYLLGDEGSGYDLGNQALCAAIRMADGRGEATALLERIMQYWQLNDIAEILVQVYPAGDTAKIARLAPLVLAAAREGDQVACVILQRAVEELALAVGTVGRKLRFSAIPLALGGGLLLHEADFREQLLSCMRRRYGLEQVTLVEQPALSAARAAL